MKNRILFASRLVTAIAVTVALVEVTLLAQRVDAMATRVVAMNRSLSALGQHLAASRCLDCRATPVVATEGRQ